MKLRLKRSRSRSGWAGNRKADAAASQDLGAQDEFAGQGDVCELGPNTGRNGGVGCSLET